MNSVATGPRRLGDARWDQFQDSGSPFQAPASTTATSSASFQEAAENLYGASYVLYSVVTAWADTIASFPRKVYARRGPNRQEREVVGDGPLVDLLAQPNPSQDGFEFFHALVVSLLLGGEAPVEKVRSRGGRPVQLLLMRPDRFGPIVNEREGLVGYQYVVGQRGYSYDPKDVIFYKLSNPTNEWRGLSPITACRLGIEVDLSASRYNRHFFENGAIPGGVLRTEQDLLATERRAIRGEWEQVHRGVSRYGRVAVLDKGLQYDGASLSQRDAQWLEGQQHAQETVFLAYRTSPAVAGLVRDVNYSNADAMFRAWYKGPIRAMVRRIESRLTRQLAREFGEEFFIELLMDDVLRPEFAERAEAGSKAWWITPDEKRKWENLPPIEGGDKLWAPVNMAVGGNPTLEVEPLPEPSPNGRKAVERKQATGTDAEEERDLLRLLEAALILQAFRVAAKFNEIIAAGGSLPGDLDAAVTLLFDAQAEAAAFEEAIAPAVFRAAGRGLSAMQQVGIGLDLTPADDLVQELVRTQQVRFAADVTATTVKAIREQLAEGIANGETLWQLRERILGYYDRNRQWRAGIAAQAETGNAYVAAKVAVARRSGVIEKKRWRTMGDARVEVACLLNEAAGAIPLEEPFPTGHHQPLAHPRCRCDIEFVLPESLGGR